MLFGDLRTLRKRMSDRGFAVRKNSRWRVFAVAVLALNVAAAVPAAAQQAQPGAVPVGTVYAERQSISKIRDFVGRVEATGRVDIRARVQGYLEQVLFKEGDIVKEGDPLYQIEKGLFQAAVERPRALGAQQGGKDADRDPVCSAPRTYWRKAPAPRWRATRRWPPISRRRARS